MLALISRTDAIFVFPGYFIVRLFWEMAQEAVGVKVWSSFFVSLTSGHRFLSDPVTSVLYCFRLFDLGKFTNTAYCFENTAYFQVIRELHDVLPELGNRRF